jgi:hypothetical protein
LAVVVPLVEAEIEGGFELVVVLGTDVVVSEVVTGVAVDVVGLDDVTKVFSASSRFYESVSAIFDEQNSIKVNCTYVLKKSFYGPLVSFISRIPSIIDSSIFVKYPDDILSFGMVGTVRKLFGRKGDS